MNTSHTTTQGRSLQGGGAPHCVFTHVFTCVCTFKRGEGCQRANTPAQRRRWRRPGQEDDTAHQSGHRGQHRHPQLLWFLTASQPPQTQPDSPTRSRIAGKQDLTRSFLSRCSLGWNEEGRRGSASKWECSESVGEKEQGRKKEEKDKEEGTGGGGGRGGQQKTRWRRW